MQLNKLIAFHKTVGDATRIRILSLLAAGPKNGQALAGILSLSPPTISHHLAKLKEINLVTDRRNKNTIYFHLNESVLHQYSQSLPKLIIGKDNPMTMDNSLQLEHRKIVDNFFSDGMLKTIPAQRKKKMIVLYHMAAGLKIGRKYTEKEINDYITQFHPDYATIRREFIVSRIMHRENAIYELNPRELWDEIVES
ncbi:metalloregulator ArsR/SmtB family transcription factor [Peribacillus psychrosaccharolyticus]|uniref:DUF2087 domain-containing protein n=1 Tax=Peribacillus psychrosaccharolyticus TaxID=1407 RepID=UPI003D2AF317